MIACPECHEQLTSLGTSKGYMLYCQDCGYVADPLPLPMLEIVIVERVELDESKSKPDVGQGEG